MKSHVISRLDDPAIVMSEADGDIIKDALSVYRDIQAYDLMVRQASKMFRNNQFYMFLNKSSGFKKFNLKLYFVG